MRAKLTHHEFNLNLPLHTSSARRFPHAVTRCGFLGALSHAAERGRPMPPASFDTRFTQTPNSATKISFFLCFSLKHQV